MTDLNSRRNADLAMIHMAGKKLFGDVSKGGHGREDYEDWLEQRTGKTSAGKLTTEERIKLIRHLRDQGLIEDRVPGGAGVTNGGEYRPTPSQWAKMAALARDLGWSKGLEDERLRGFVKRTAKISSTRFLTRGQASEVITAMGRWKTQRILKKAHEQDQASKDEAMGGEHGMP